MPAGPSRPTFLVGLLLPWVTLAAVTAATYPRLTRSSMPEVLGEDYIRTAPSKGLSEEWVGYRLLDPRVRPS
jgi:peptide/nickel transport system permease protein